MLQAYFDESGTHGDARVTCIAGYVGTADQWAHVENQWQEILKPRAAQGLTWWHMADFRARRGQYERIDTPTGNQILDGLVRIVRESELQVIWAGVDAEVYAAITTPESRGRLGHKPYDFCFYLIVRQLAIWSARRGFKDSIGMMFAIQDEYNKASEMALESWHRFGVLEQLETIAFAYPRKRPALQCADMLANEVYGLWMQYARDKSTNTVNLSQLLQDITKSGLKQGGFATERTIRNYMADPHSAWANP